MRSQRILNDAQGAVAERDVGKPRAMRVGVIAVILCFAVAVVTLRQQLKMVRSEGEHARAVLTAAAEADRINGTASVEPTPACKERAALEASIFAALDAGRPAMAGDVAELALELLDPTCIGDGIAAIWYRAKMDGLFSLPRPSRAPADFDGYIVDQWRRIESEASRYKMASADKLPPASVFVRAYNSGLWALADAAYREAVMGNGAVWGMCGERYAVLRNWGRAVAEFGADPARASELLATARAVALACGLPSGEACGDLETVLGFDDCNEAEPDPGEPILAGGA